LPLGLGEVGSGAGEGILRIRSDGYSWKTMKGARGPHTPSNNFEEYPTPF